MQHQTLDFPHDVVALLGFDGTELEVVDRAQGCGACACVADHCGGKVEVAARAGEQQTVRATDIQARQAVDAGEAALCS